MSLAITLFHFESDDIKIDIEARFEGDALVVEGYDIGKRVKEYWGDSDYEYSVTVAPQNVLLLFSVLVIPLGDRQGLLNEIARRFHTNTCFSDFRKLLEDNHIPSSGFSWV